MFLHLFLNHLVMASQMGYRPIWTTDLSINSCVCEKRLNKTMQVLGIPHTPGWRISHSAAVHDLVAWNQQCCRLEIATGCTAADPYPEQ